MQMVMGDLMHGMEGGGAAPRILGHLQSRIEVPDLPDYTPAEKLRLEREALGFVLTRNEMELYAREAGESGAVLASDLVAHAGREVKVAGTIVAGRRHMAKSGEWMLFASLQDSAGLIEVVLFPDAYREHGETLANGGCGPYVVRGTVQVTGKGRAIGIQPPEGLRPGDEAVLKMHPVLIAEEVRLLA
jgi:DNA polymerase III alpha subunit